MLASSLPKSTACDRSPASAQPCAKRNSTSFFLRRLGRGYQAQRFLEVSLGEAPVVAGLEAMAQLRQGLPTQTRVAARRL